MPQIHDTDNYTVPGGIKLFFNDGTGERDLGNMIDVSLGRESEDLEHYTNRPGTRVKDKVITLQESISIDFALDEPVIENFILFFKGSAAVNQGAGTAVSTDQKVTLGASYSFVSLLKHGPISTYSVRQFLDYVYFYDDPGLTYTDRSAEADTAAVHRLRSTTPHSTNCIAGRKPSSKKSVSKSTWPLSATPPQRGSTGTARPGRP